MCSRTITFALLCILAYAVCFGFTLAIVAGIAYGYNYSLAEFISYSRSDVTVFMRRGQFYDKPDLPIPGRRSGGGEEEEVLRSRPDLAPQNEKRLADTWMQSQDTKNYAEKLTKYSPILDSGEIPVVRSRELTPVESLSDQALASAAYKPEIYHNIQDNNKMPPSDVVSVQPGLLIPTLTWPSGSSQIVMRNYKPLEDINTPVGPDAYAPEDLFASTEQSLKSMGFVNSKPKTKGLPGLPGPPGSRRGGVAKEGFEPMRVWATTRRPVIPDYVTEDVDEDTIVYKPI